MRSELVYWAGQKIGNRFLLTSVTIKAVRKLHINSARTEDTANSVFQEVAAGRYTDVRTPELEPQVAMDPPLISAA